MVSPTSCSNNGRGANHENVSRMADAAGSSGGSEKLPMMSDAELDEFAADIKANGLLDPIILWRDNREEANGATGPFPTVPARWSQSARCLGTPRHHRPRQATTGRKTTNKS